MPYCGLVTLVRTDKEWMGSDRVMQPKAAA